MKNGTLILTILYGITLTSCSVGGDSNIIKAPEKNEIYNQAGKPTTGTQTTIEVATTKNNEEVSREEILPPKQNSDSSGGNILPKENTIGSKIEHSYSIESVDKINSQEEIKSINHIMGSEFGGDNSPEYLEFQKNQMKLGLLISQIKDPEYIKLRDEQRKIREGKEIWTKKLSKADVLLEEAMNHIEEVSSRGETMKLLARKRAQAMTEFQASEEYKNYIDQNKDKLISIEKSMMQYYTPEIQALQEKIQIYMISHTGTILRLHESKN